MILIVDDNRQNIFSLKALLELHKFRVDTAFSGQEALKCVLKNDYSLIILDVQMPEMDGFEVAEAISGSSKSRDIPIIFLSAINVEKSYLVKGYAAGGVDYVTKPFDADILILKVKTFYRLSEQKRKLLEMDRFLREEIECRKKAETALEYTVAELKSILESMPQMAFTCSNEGQIEFVNKHWLAYSAHARDLPLMAEGSVAACINEAIASASQLIKEVQIKRLDADEYHFHLLYMTPVIQGNDIIKWVGVFTDIHAQKAASQLLEKKVEERTQELQRTNEELENRNAELQRFAFVASHDLQEPLRKIQIFSDLIIKKFTHDVANTEKFLNKIIRSAERMRTLINSLLTYSRLPEQASYERVDLKDIVVEVMRDLEIRIEEQNARIHVGQLPLIEAIPGQMAQVFHNLISNALKFSKENSAPEVTVTAEFIEQKSFHASASDTGDFCRIVVDDKGTGFNQRYADKIFEVFQRLNQRPGCEGAGIGLAIVKKIIDRHHGLIRVASKENEGTAFTIILPVSQRSMN